MLKRTILLMAMVTISSAWGTARAEVLERTKFKGSQASTSFSSVTPITCEDGSENQLFVDGFISGAEQIAKAKGSPKTAFNGSFISVSTFNGCTGESRFLSGGTTGGFDTPNRRLNRAGVEGSTLLQDFNDGAQFAFEMDLEFEGIGELSAGKSHDRTVQVLPDGTRVVTISQSANANREAAVTGTITLDGVELAPQFSFSSLVFNGNSQLIIERP